MCFYIKHSVYWDLKCYLYKTKIKKNISNTAHTYVSHEVLGKFRLASNISNTKTVPNAITKIIKLNHAGLPFSIF